MWRANRYERAILELHRRQKEGIEPDDEDRLLDELEALWSDMTPDERNEADRLSAGRAIRMRD